MVSTAVSGVRVRRATHPHDLYTIFVLLRCITASTLTACVHTQIDAGQAEFGNASTICVPARRPSDSDEASMLTHRAHRHPGEQIPGYEVTVR